MCVSVRADVHAFKVVESLNSSQQEGGGKRRRKREPKGSIIGCLLWCHLLFQSKVGAFYFERAAGLLHTCLGTSRLVRSALCNPTLPRSKIDWWHILQSAEPLLGHTWNMLVGRSHKHGAAPPVAEQNSHSDTVTVWRNLEAYQWGTLLYINSQLLWSTPACPTQFFLRRIEF